MIGGASVAGGRSEGVGGRGGGGAGSGQVCPPVSRRCPSGCWLEAGSDEDHAPPAPPQWGAARRPSSGRWDVSGRGRATSGRCREGTRRRGSLLVTLSPSC